LHIAPDNPKAITIRIAPVEIEVAAKKIIKQTLLLHIIQAASSKESVHVDLTMAGILGNLPKSFGGNRTYPNPTYRRPTI
jgi:hypothetical protein